MLPQFSPDFSSLIYYGSEAKFKTHTGNYQLFSMNWPLASEQATVIDHVPIIISGEFAGLYGYQATFSQSGFIGNSSRFFITSSEFKSQERIFLVDMISHEIK
jgi:hypothetical protein